MNVEYCPYCSGDLKVGDYINDYLDADPEFESVCIHCKTPLHFDIQLMAIITVTKIEGVEMNKDPEA